MITENLSTLKIHKLSQSQYNRELEAGRIDENALYLTPDEEIDLTALGVTATAEELNYMDGVTSNVQTQLSSKQNTIRGSAGDFVVIGADGNIATKTIAIAEEVTF